VNNDNSKKWGKVESLLLIGIILTVISPWIFTLNSIGISFDESTGPIGDTIGGITNPIVGLMGAILVYYALKEQIKANQIIQDQLKSQKTEELTRKKIEHINQQIQTIENDINSFSIVKKVRVKIDRTSHEQPITVSGTEAVESFIEKLAKDRSHRNDSDSQYEIPKLFELTSIISLAKSLVDVIDNSNIPTIDKEFFKSRLNYIFQTKLVSSFKKNEDSKLSKIELCSCGNKHGGIPDDVFDEINELELKLKTKTTTNNMYDSISPPSS